MHPTPLSLHWYALHFGGMRGRAEACMVSGLILAHDSDKRGGNEWAVHVDGEPADIGSYYMHLNASV